MSTGVRKPLGTVITGSLMGGLEVKLNPGKDVEELAVGRYVVIIGKLRRFFGMVTNVGLATSNPQIALSPPDLSDQFVQEVLDGIGTYSSLEVTPMLMLPLLSDTKDIRPEPVKTVPRHFSTVFEANENDVHSVFGDEQEKNNFVIGTPLDMDTRVCIDLGRFVARSSGVFGKSGTGKTFLTRLLLAGIAQRGSAVNLVFDMHNEYGWGSKDENGKEVKGLKQLYNAKVIVYTLDEVSSKRRGAQWDERLEIALTSIEPEDIALMQEALGLSAAALESVYELAKRFGANWLTEFVELGNEELEELARERGFHSSTLGHLYRKLKRLTRLPFLRQKTDGDSLEDMLATLTSGKHVVLEFGGNNSLDAYMLVANVLTRRIHERFVELTDLASGDKSRQPPNLVITIEEAHKFLSPAIADQTIFGTIARELRKYHVTLLVVDQRPSAIADEVMSQIGTRVTCLLDDEKDIGAVLSGVSGASSLRSVLARLDSQQQALILGHAVPMPVVVRTREYDANTYRELGFVDAEELKTTAAQDVADLFDD